MRTHALPLQILLALALVLNGIGGAIAGVSAALAPPISVASIQAVDVDAAPGDCVGHLAGNAAEATPQLPPQDCHSGDGPGCDHGLQCLQVCMHLMAAVAPLLPVGIVQAGTDAVLHPLATGHPPPPRASPTRPPIA